MHSFSAGMFSLTEPINLSSDLYLSPFSWAVVNSLGFAGKIELLDVGPTVVAVLPDFDSAG